LSTNTGGGEPSEESKALAEEVTAHLRAVAGADAVLSAYNIAREAVRRARSERKQRAALRTMLDPEAEAKRK
jgi:U3 small nucleolar RNA-associated protein 20